jgi:hypothetical protein
MLDQLVWRDKEVGEFVNRKFVSLRVIPDGREWSALRSQFQSQGTPTVIFLKASGEEIDPKSAETWDTLGRLSHEKNDQEKAVAAMEKSVELNPGNKNFAKTPEKFKEEKQ